MLKNKLSLILKILLIPAFILLLLSIRFYWGNKKFLDLTTQLFENEITKNTLNLHYTLADPASFGITDYEISLGTADPDILRQEAAELENYREALSMIPESNLSQSNRLTYDILLLYLNTQATGKDYLLYAEPLGPTTGTQAQLPVLLAEYSFSDADDVEEYLALISEMDTYYESIIAFEREKSAAGLFMNDTNADNIISQCQAFISTNVNCLIPTFEEKIDTMAIYSAEEKAALKKRHKEVIAAHVIPAYQLLIDGLTALKGSGSNNGGLANYENGIDYYQYLVKDATGCYDSIDSIEARIQSQLKADFQELQTLVTEHPNLLTDYSTDSLDVTEPTAILEELQAKIGDDFPTAPTVNCSIKYVHESLEDFLSPAFYLTPPLDNLSENVIYINNVSDYSPLELYTTLAHEGYPGHLYQTVYSGSTSSNKVRSLLNFGGYVEGWATYVEMYSYALADTKPEYASLHRLNRSITLGLSSLLDLAIHYHGFTRENVTDYLNRIGFSGSNMAGALYDAIIESPANYLKYYLGYLNFTDLRTMVEKDRGEKFSLKEFHQEILEIGPAPFPVLKKYLLS